MRIEKSGGHVHFDGVNHRVRGKDTPYPGINVSRSLGDLFGHNNTGLSAEPHIREYSIDAEDEVLIICSDGVWEFMSKDEVCRTALQFNREQAMQASESLAKAAWDSWMGVAEEENCEPIVDDITALCIYLQP